MNNIYIDLSELPFLNSVIDNFDSEETYCPHFEVMKESGFAILDLEEFDRMRNEYEESGKSDPDFYSHWIYNESIKKANYDRMRGE